MSKSAWLQFTLGCGEAVVGAPSTDTRVLSEKFVAEVIAAAPRKLGSGVAREAPRSANIPKVIV